MARAPFQVLVIPYRWTAGGSLEFALLRRVDQGYWHLVAGGGESGESALEAAQRELVEETGLFPGSPMLRLDTVQSIPASEFSSRHLWGDQVYVITEYCFGAEILGGDIVLSPEHSEYGWVSYEQAQQLLRYDSNKTALWELNNRLSGLGAGGKPLLATSDSSPLHYQPTVHPYSLVFLKLGGSLITEKAQPHTARPQVIARLAEEIVAALQADPGLRLVLGHGSGSFGHVPAKKYGTRQGVRTLEQWHGFVEVWREAVALNRIVVDVLQDAGLPALVFSPAASITAHNGRIVDWNLVPLRKALGASLLPVVYGDVIFDEVLGGTILSTEDLFAYLAVHLKPGRILLAGLEPGVWADFPACKRLIPEISHRTLPQVKSSLGGSAATDVTGGMSSKVTEMLSLIEHIPGLEALIFSGEVPGQMQQALLGGSPGTILK